MNIFYFVRSLEAVPSCTYNILMLSAAGYRVIPVLGKSTSTLNRVLDENKIQYIDCSMENKGGEIAKFLSLNVSYRKAARKAMKQYKRDDIIIFGTADSAIYVGGICKKSKYMLSLKELYEKPVFYQIILEKLSHKAVGVICCEINRARLIKIRWGLSKLPYVISNKPYNHPEKRELMPSSGNTREIIERIRGKMLVVYQARHINYVNELENLAKGLKIADKNYTLALIGTVDHPEDIDKINSIYSNTIWTGHIPSPLHLEVTSYAYIGVAVYEESSLNNMFCAPNKTYEYAGYGIPTLCNDVPGLVETIGIKNAGVCVNWSKPEKIAAALNEISANYELYSKNSLALFKDEDNLEIIKDMITEIASM